MERDKSQLSVLLVGVQAVRDEAIQVLFSANKFKFSIHDEMFHEPDKYVHLMKHVNLSATTTSSLFHATGVALDFLIHTDPADFSVAVQKCT